MRLVMFDQPFCNNIIKNNLVMSGKSRTFAVVFYYKENEKNISINLHSCYYGANGQLRRQESLCN